MDINITTFGFTDDDLKSNQRGAISPRQREWLKTVAHGARSFSWRGAFITVVVMFFGLCLVFVLYLQNDRSRAAFISNPANWIVFPLIILAVLGILALSIFLAYRTANRLENAAVLSVTGNVRFDEDSSGKSGVTSYYVFVGKKRFSFANNMSHTFKDGEKYKVYYCKARAYEFVLSFEQVKS